MNYKISLLLFILLWHYSSFATTYYFNSQTGNDNNSGTEIASPFKSLDKASKLNLKAGDKILLAAGCTFCGTLELEGISGSAEKPVTISRYENEETTNKLPNPIIDAKGFANGLLLKNCSYILAKNFEITGDGDGLKTLKNKKQNMRCGVLVTTSEPGNYKGITLQNLLIQNIFFEDEGFKRGKDEVRTANGSQSYGWGIRFINSLKDAWLKDLTVESCVIKNIAHTGIKFTGRNKSIHNIKLYNNEVIEVGGPGIQMSGVSKGHINKNNVNRSGSNNDSRKWGRGSGLWTWGSSDIIIEKNSFQNANGPGDSAGCHIDFNCNNVIVQYNLSANNAGGFCEILGNNYNCAYRYNISINDGHRIKGVNRAFQEGKIFWLSGFQGKNRPRNGPFNSYFYNNTIYVKSDIVAKIAVDKASSGVLIANNIFYIEGQSKAVLGDQYRPETKGESRVEDIFFQNNLYLHKENWPKDVLIRDNQPIFGNPQFAKTGGDKLSDYRPGNRDLIRDKGIRIKSLPGDSIGLYIGLSTEHDILGNKIIGIPDMGAIELN
jgi:hypothetical protein